MTTIASTTTVSTSSELPQPTNLTGCSFIPEQWQLPIDAVSLLSSLIALLATLLALFFIVLFKRWNILNQRLILYLCIATVVALVTNMLSRVTQREFCVLAGFGTQIGGWMALNAYICITLTLMLSVFLTKKLKKPDIWVIVFIFGTPFCFNWIPFINYSYGQSGIACWIKFNEMVNGTCQTFKFGLALQLILWYIPLYLSLGVMIILYAIILVRFYFYRRQWMQFDQNRDNERSYALHYVTSLLAYPLIYFIANTAPFIFRLYVLANPTSNSVALIVIGVITYTQQGTGIAIAVLLNIRKKLNYPSLKSAVDNWCNRGTVVKEYTITEGKEENDDDYGDDEESVSYKLYSDDKSSVVS